MIGVGLDVSLVVADRPCAGLDVAARAHVQAVLLDRRDYGGFTDAFEREAYSGALSRLLTDADVDLVAMAGFGTVVTATVHAALPGRILNTHPSLLPAFPGWHAVAAALDAGVTETGCTVHVATAALDDGPVLARRRVPVHDDDNERALHERIKVVERELYPRVVGRVMAALARGEEPTSVAETEDG